MNPTVMNKALFLFTIIIGVFVAPAKAQLTKRQFTPAEVKTLSHYNDSILQELKYLYKLEVKEQAPGKYQPQRIALVRSFLWTFQYLEQQKSVVSISKRDVMKILGKADSISSEDGYEIFQYNGINKPYLHLKNFRYTLVFNKDELVMVRQNLQ